VENYFDYEELADGLRVFLTEEGKANVDEIRDGWKGMSYWGCVDDILDSELHIIGNGYDILSPVLLGWMVGDEMTIIGKDIYLDTDTERYEYEPDTKIWYDNNYMLFDWTNKLLERGEYVFIEHDWKEDDEIEDEQITEGSFDVTKEAKLPFNLERPADAVMDSTDIKDYYAWVKIEDEDIENLKDIIQYVVSEKTTHYHYDLTEDEIGIIADYVQEMWNREIDMGKETEQTTEGKMKTYKVTNTSKIVCADGTYELEKGDIISIKGADENLFYTMYYDDVISKELDHDEKMVLARKISNLAQMDPFWLSDDDYINEFPELRDFIVDRLKLSGQFLYSIMRGLARDLKMPL